MESRNIDDSVVTANNTKLSIRNGNPTIIYDCNEATIRLNLPLSYLILGNLFILFWSVILKKNQHLKNKLTLFNVNRKNTKRQIS